MADRKPVRVRLADRRHWRVECAACGYRLFTFYRRDHAIEDAHRHARHCEAIALQYLDHDESGSWCTKGNCSWQSTTPDDQDTYLAHYERSHTL